jgi:hypothetical protein
LSQYAKITKGRALKEYSLREVDLLTLPRIYKQNPHYRSAAQMQLFSIDDVAAASKARQQAKQDKIQEKLDLALAKQKKKKSKKRKREDSDSDDE